MLKKIASLALFAVCAPLSAANYVNLYQAPLSHLTQLTSLNQQNNLHSSAALNSPELKLLSKTRLDNAEISRFQQHYQGIAIVGAQITVSKDLVNGHLFDDINLNTTPALSANEAILSAKKTYFANKSPMQTHAETSKLQIRADKDNKLQLVYLVSFKSVTDTHKPVWPFFVVDAQTGEPIKVWDNIQTYMDSGPGGNEKVKEYWYGKDGLPGLDVSQEGETCTMDNQKVSLVNVNSEWDWEGKNLKPVKYSCNNNVEDFINGAYSAGNDAYYFGHVIVNLYKDWYGINALQDDKGQAEKLIMRVHFGENYDNAFWNGQSMAFGDGSYFYPLVSLDVAGHEVSHGFTQQHANLEYHDESGALNESFSDMAGQAARAYLLETSPQLYNKAYLTPNEVTWGIGETIIGPLLPIKALRFMDLPSLDHVSADCLDKKMARSNQSICAISYEELLLDAKRQYPLPEDEDERQSYLVHTASGIFNRTFYLMAKQLGIKEAFHTMLVANTKYWTPTSNFNEAACGVIYAARDLKINTDFVQSAFNKTGISTTSCSPPN